MPGKTKTAYRNKNTFKGKLLLGPECTNQERQNVPDVLNIVFRVEDLGRRQETS